MKTCSALLTVILCGLPYAGAKAAEGDKPAEAQLPNVDIEKIRALVAKLASDDYQQRVQATKDLSAMPEEAFPLIEEEAKKWNSDPEVAARIAEVRQHVGLKALKTKDEVLTYLQHQFAAAAHDGRFGKATSAIEEGLEKLKQLTPKKEWHATIAKVYYDAGMIFYKAGHTEKTDRWILGEAVKLLTKASDAYDEALKSEPNNKELENAQIECNMILYAAHKFQTF